MVVATAPDDRDREAAAESPDASTHRSSIQARRTSLRTVALTIGCACALACAADAGDTKVAAAEAAITSFYAFDSTRLDSLLRTVDSSRHMLLSYQRWAEGGNYSVEQRTPCRVESAGTVACAVTVQDDIVRSLQLDSWVTDTFRFSFIDTRLSSVATSSNDPPAVGAAFAWVRQNKPQLFDSTGVCTTTAGLRHDARECARAVMVAFREYRDRPTP